MTYVTNFGFAGAVAVVAIAASGSAHAVECAEPSGNFGCFTTIQAAIDAAVDGERVRVFPGTYHEIVDIDKPGLRLIGENPPSPDGMVGPGESVIEGTIPPSLTGPALNGDTITVNAPNVQVRNLVIRNAEEQGIRVFGANVDIRRVKMLATGGACIILDEAAQGAMVENLRLFGCGASAVVNEGDPLDGVTVRRVQVTFCDDTCIRLEGDDLLIERNRMLLNAEGSCIEVRGDNAQVLGNRMRNCEIGVDLIGSNPIVTDNRVDIVGDHGFAIECDVDPCDGGRVANNTTSGATVRFNGYNIFAATAGFVVENNTAEEVADSGFELDGEGMVINGNTVQTSGAEIGEAGFRIRGTGHQLDGNTASGGGSYGFNIGGSQHTLIGNQAVGNFGGGFDVVGGAADIELIDNRADDNIAMGFQVSQGATNTEVTNNQGSGNGIDFCDEGTGTVVNGNAFGTTSATCYSR